MNKFRMLLARGATAMAAAMLLLAPMSCESTPVVSPPDWFEGGAMKPASAETLQLTARVLAAKGETAKAGYILDLSLIHISEPTRPY